jgi:hypothetical protein
MTKRTTSKKKPMKSKKRHSRTRSMSKTLYLTKEEQKLFKKLPAAAQKGWEVEMDKAAEMVDDDAERMGVRFSMISASNGALAKVRRQAVTLSSEKDVEELLENIDLRSVSEKDWKQLLIAFGPFGLTALIEASLDSVKTQNDMDQIAILSIVRNAISI